MDLEDGNLVKLADDGTVLRYYLIYSKCIIQVNRVLMRLEIPVIVWEMIPVIVLGDAYGLLFCQFVIVLLSSLLTFGTVIWYFTSQVTSEKTLLTILHH